ncbi:MAG: coenzyme F420-0:L-glutamate ligase [Anaerolineales bacterium]|nr:coenzyme F420-0:L-glutamate ligase [Anaerolineales bacterium]
MRPLTLTALPGLPMIQPGDDLAALILEAMQRAGLQLEPSDIFVLAQKIVSKAEGRKVNLATVTPSPRAAKLGAEIEKDPRLIELILQESDGQVLRTRPGLIIVEHRLGFVCANAGIDHSNVAGDEEWVLLLPENPDASAEGLRQQLEAMLSVRVGNSPDLGVMIIDSHGRAWRNGTVGVAIGISGLPGVVDLRGQPDLTGRILQVTQVGVADELAAAASLVMGQAAEGTPVVHVRGFPYPLRDGKLKELIRAKETDLFR